GLRRISPRHFCHGSLPAHDLDDPVPVATHNITQSLFNVDLYAKENVAGLHRLVVDMVLAFLTSNIPDSGHQSYLEEDISESKSDSSASIYEDGSDDIFS